MLLLLALLFPLGAWADVPPDCSIRPDTLPNPSLPAGTPDPRIPIEHVIVIMQENHSFDNYFGKLNDPKHYGSALDGVTSELSNPDVNGNAVHPFHQGSFCVADPDHEWDPQHFNWDGGAMDRFVINNSAGGANGARVMGYYTEQDLNFYYALADEFAVADRYFCSVMGPTLPNRYFLMAASAFGHIENDLPPLFKSWQQRTIFDQLQKYGVGWKYYHADWAYLAFFDTFWQHLDHTGGILDFQYDLHHGKLPAVSFVESSVLGSDEHPPNNIQTGQGAVADRVKDLLKSPYWKDSVLFLTYDENGGYYDHVPPPPACKPDSISPETEGHFPAEYDHTGFRVPFVAISPFAKRHYVSHQTYDHTSILGFIEHKFNVPPITFRDANADPMMDFFDFAHPQMDKPKLPKADHDFDKAFKCLIPPGPRGF
jgi:phospholipase C